MNKYDAIKAISCIIAKRSRFFSVARIARFWISAI